MRTTTRRSFLRSTGLATGGALLLPFGRTELVPDSIQARTVHGGAAALQAAQSALDKMRAQMASVPIESTRLGDRLLLLSGPGGNVVVLHGPDGKIVADTFVESVWPKLKGTLEGIGNSPITAAIDTHWHFDHSDNNANLRRAGAKIVAHDKTKERMSQTHELLGMRFEPSPPDALPTDTFKDEHTLSANGEQITLTYVPPAHTDTDILVRYAKGNVIHMGDLFFNGMYPFIDAGTAGNINGMVAAADRTLKIADGQTKIVPGHGPLGDKAALEKYRTMLATVRDQVRERKAKGETLMQVQAAKPTAQFDGEWGKGMMPPDAFVALVYDTL